MKIRLLHALVGLAIGLALPTFAQQRNAPDPKLREQFIEAGNKFNDAFVKGDAAFLGSSYTEDAVLVNDDGPVYSREAIEKLYENLFKMVRFTKHLSTLDQYSPHIIGTSGNEAWATGEWSQTVKGQNFGPLDEKGYWTCIYVRQGDVWKVRVNTWNRLKVYTPAPAAPAQTNAAPTSAQEKSMVDPQVRQRIEGLMMKFQEAFNNRDTATIGTLQTEDIIEVRSWPKAYNGGLASGREALKTRFEADFATNPGKMVNKLVQLYPIGNALCEITDSDVGGHKAQTVTIWVPEGDSWKARMTYVNNEQSVVDPQIRQQIEAPFIKFQEAYNNRDAAAIAALQTENAIEVRSWPKAYNGGLASGREALKTRFEADFATNPGKMVNKLVQLYPIGSAICEIADSDVGGSKVQTMVIYVLGADTWKRCVTYVANAMP
jgi:ketosteroid isomerase-like protein